MKTRKLMAILVMVAMIVTALPMVAFAAEPANRHSSLFEVNKTSVEADDDSLIKFTVYTLTRDNDPVSAAVYFASDRDDAEVFLDDEDNEVDHIVTDASDGKGEFWVKSSVAGKAVIGLGLKPEIADYMIDDDVTAVEAGLIGTQAVEFTAAKSETVKVVSVKPRKEDAITDKDELDKVIDGGQLANGLDYYEVTFRVTTAGGARVKGEEVVFSVDKGGASLNKTSAETNMLGEAKVRVFASKPGTYNVEGKVGKEKANVDVRFNAGDVAGLELVSGDGKLVAQDTEHTIKVKMLDINGNKISVNQKDYDNGKDYSEGFAAKYDVDLEVVTEPDDSDIDLIASDELDDDSYFVVKTSKLEEEGEYTVRVALANGKYVEASFEVKEQGDIVELEVEYPQKAVPFGGKVGAPTITRIDDQGIEEEVDLDVDADEFRFVASDVRKIAGKIKADGSFTVTDDDDYAGLLTITVIDTEENLSASFDIMVGVEPASFDLELEGDAVTGEEAKVWLQFYDAQGNEIAFGDDEDLELELEGFVFSKPSDARVYVDVRNSDDVNEELKEDGKTYVKISSNKDGAVKVQLVVTATYYNEGDTEEEVKTFANSITLNFGEEGAQVVEGAEKVVLTIGSNIAVVDGVAQEFDAPAFIEEGRTYVPFRFIAEAFGAEVDWTPKDGPTETVFLTRGDMEISIGIGDSFLTITRDGEAEVQAFDGAAQIKEGRTFLPFRAIAEAFGAEVDYGPADGPVEWVSFQQ